MKAFPTEALTHTPISAVLDIVKSNDLKPEQMEKVHIRSLARVADIFPIPANTIRGRRKRRTIRCPM